MESMGPVPGNALVASPVPFGLGSAGPSPVRSALAALAANAHASGWAWRVLAQGVSETSAFGVRGLQDGVLPPTVLEPARLDGLRHHTADALTPSDLDRLAHLRALSADALLELGRLPFPFLREPGDRGFTRIGWDDALAMAAGALEGPDTAWLVGDTVSSETSWTVGHAARAFGSERLLHSGAPPVTGPLRHGLGVDQSTCGLTDLIGTDLVLVAGPMGRHPLLARYLRAAKERGTRVVFLTDHVPTSLESAWSTGSLSSLFFGTRLPDDVIPVEPGGTEALLLAVLRLLVSSEGMDREFVDAHTTGFAALRDRLLALDLRSLERQAGLQRGTIEWLGELIGRARNVVTVYDGLPAPAVSALVDLHLLRGAIGRPLTGLLPLFAGPGLPGACLAGFTDGDLAGAESLAVFGADLSAHDGLENVGTRVHVATHLDPSMLVEPAERVLLLPMQSVHEQRGGTAWSTVDRRFFVCPELSDHPILGESRPAWQIPGRLLEVAGKADGPPFRTTRAVREAMVASHPDVGGLVDLDGPSESFQVGGPLLCEGGRFPTDDGNARFSG